MRITPYILVALLVWTIVIVASAFVQIHTHHHSIQRIAEYQTQTAFEKDMLYRKWATMHGGVYVPVTDSTQPNPWLSHIPERDITTPSGRKLTLMNPAFMTRQVHDIGKTLYRLKGHITSLKPINPANTPDNWERHALQRFEQGEQSVYGFDTIDGETRFRYMHVMMTDKNCLKCHAAHGYLEGEPRGGISVALSMSDLEVTFADTILLVIVFHVIIWFAGSGMILFAGVTLHRRAVAQQVYTAGLADAKKREEQERERLSVTLRSIGDGVITTDTRGTVVMLNKAAEEMTGWKSGEAAGHPLSEVFFIINELSREPCEDPVKKVLSTGNIVELANHTCLVTRDHRELIIADSAAPIKGNDGAVIGVVLVFRDMTEKVRLQEAIQTSSKLESLGILAGGIAHDFNNLLGGIFGNIDLANDLSASEELSGYLRKALSTIDRARGLTSQLLTFAKGGAPVKQLERLFPFVKDAAQFALSGSNVSCQFTIDEDLWPCNFDQNQIGQVIDNIVINAQQAMPAGGTIEISACNVTSQEKLPHGLSMGRHVKISIRDTGPGIPRECISRIFDPFYTTKPKGHGLGLATCYSIINRHGGSIDVESEPGNGTTFHIYLPASTEQVMTEAAMSPRMHKGSGIFLVVDDEDVMLDMIGTMLESFGYSAVLKESAEAALSWFSSMHEKQHIAGMLFDLTIPGSMGGREAVLKVREISTDIPVFVASGYAEDPVMSDPARFGFTASICKPFMRSELAAMLNAHIKIPV